jgi:3-phytase
MLAELSTPDSTQAQNVAAIIQRVRPDVLLLNEFDYEPEGALVEAFQRNYLSVAQADDLEPIEYPYSFVAPSNTGVASGFDLDNDGSAWTDPAEGGDGNDAFGFGTFEGQHGMAVLSMLPIDEANVRTFRTFLWQDMPGALLPDDPATEEPADWYSPAESAAFRLSSKSHWDIPLDWGIPVRFLVSHPTSPVFDGEEDRNGRRNHDEIRFWTDYISGGDTADYIHDDVGVGGGLEGHTAFVIAGDLNIDPFDGDGIHGGIIALLEHPFVNDEFVPTSEGAVEQAELQGGANALHEADPAADTADFEDADDSDTAPGNLRVDYVLPSGDFVVVGSGVHWPRSDDRTFPPVGVVDPETCTFPSSDHRLVWVDLAIPVH